ncbi:MAG: glycine cleavage system aminomethyltransferase GcvT [Propionibacterium sp.]|nr:glycine cleavage system aminomethyltransferase GcvT [Propionibacterium sp.]
MAEQNPSQALIQSPVHARHVEARAKFAPFGGWDMPVEYGGAGVLVEHRAVRTGVGIFDVSHLGKLSVTGPGAVDHLNTALTNDLNKIGAGQAQYTLVCNDRGGVVDDLIAYRRGDDDVLLVPNAANNATVAEMLREGAPEGVRVTDQHRELAVFAIQGTHSDEVLGGLGIPVGHDYMAFVEHDLDGTPITVCRSGYTGERGYELIVPSGAATRVWDAVVAAGEPYGLQLCGLGARDTLRTEMGYALHGQDLSPDFSALEARVGWAIAWDKPEFRGREALLETKEAKPNRLLRGIRAIGRGIPRPGMTVQSAQELELGTVTSGTFSPTLKEGIGLALLDRSVAVGDVVQVQVRARTEEFRVVTPPFVEPSVREH